MSEENRKLGIRWFEEIWNQRRTDTIDELMSPDSVGHMEGGDVRGPEEFKRACAALLDAFPDLRVFVESAVADASQVAVRWRVQATHAGGGLGFAATHRPVAFRGITWIHIVNGKIVEGWDAWNQNALFGELTAAAMAAASKPKKKAAKKPLLAKRARPKKAAKRKVKHK